PDLTADVMRHVVQPVLDLSQSDGDGYRGFLYVSLMLTAAGPKVIEFNVRFGDPEAQVVLPSLDGPFARALYASATGRLDEVALTTSADCLVGVVLAAPGYPGAVATGRPIAGAERAAAMPNVMVFHAGTRIEGGT